ncbi:MAG: MFS transporter [Bacteroidota bacterium]
MHPSPRPPAAPFSRSRIFVWTLFDFANTSFSVLIVAVGYSLYFREVVAGGAGRGDFLWGLAVSVSMLATALLAPLLGAASDAAGLRKRFLLSFTALSVLSTAGLWTVEPGMVMQGALLFILANVGFEGGIVFYNAFLPGLAPPSLLGRVSGYGFAMGYAGSLASLLLAAPLFAGGFAPGNLPHIRLSFLLAAGMFALFSAPLFLFLREAPDGAPRAAGLLRTGYDRVFQTLRHLRLHRHTARFLLAFFFYNDGVLTVIAFASIFAQETLGFSLQDILLLFALVQASALGGSVLVGHLADRIGPKHTITLTLVIWLGIVVSAVLVDSAEAFYAVGIAAGAAMGGAQSASRSMMALLTPPHREAEFFGFYDGFCGKGSAVLGTFLFGFLSWTTGDQRTAILCIGAFFLAGLLLLQRVEDPFRRDGAVRPGA